MASAAKQQAQRDAAFWRESMALWYVAPQRAEVRATALARSGADDLALEAEVSLISRGTERLVFEGKIPADEQDRMRAPYQEGAFPFPVKYGYAMVARDANAPVQRYFCLYPHQARFFLPTTACIPLPEDVPSRRLTLAANMETAVNAIWDGNAGPGDRILVIGAGVVGALIAYLTARIPGVETTLVDIDPRRAALARVLGCAFASPERAPGGQDLIFHTSASAAGLNLAIAKAGFEARVVEVSWHGSRATPIRLGGAFHSQRLRLISSQVGHLPANRRLRWDFRRRLTLAINLARDPVLDALFAPSMPLAEIPAALPRIFSPESSVIAQPIIYGESQPLNRAGE